MELALPQYIWFEQQKGCRCNLLRQLRLWKSALKIFFEGYIMNPVLEILIWKFLSIWFRWSGLVDSWIVKSIIQGRGPG